MIRIGIFSVLYTVPASIVLGCHIYESSQQTAWLSALACPCEPQVRPLYSVVMLKYFMQLAVGITSGVWIWSGKTADAWRTFWRRLCSGGSAGRTGVSGAIGAGIGANLDGHRGAEQALIKQGPLGSGVMGYHQAVYGNTLPGAGVTSLGSMASASHHLLAPHVTSTAAANSGSASCCKQSLSHV
uniref:Putative secreted protein n=1 Tax=Xenopsylla cheopis TaxID=163159 RepID=A0A6M2DYV8_XENCH